MKRLHIHIAVKNLSESIGFYSTLLGSPPTAAREDYAKWNLHDPAVNFAISMRGHSIGINHLGFQVDSEEELREISERLDKASMPSTKQENASCCYSRSNKHWTLDPQGIAWESFHTVGHIDVFGEDTQAKSEENASVCCIPLHNENVENETECCIPNENEVTGCCS